ncbi:MAG: carbohydrate ABC transporter permease [Ruminococcaceae bacterium]|nr:carbohydrate ABC transporter permease [Oscillospiraceae bacterium]
MKKKISVFDIINFIICGLIGLVCVYPFYYVVMASFSDPSKLMGHNGVLLAPLDSTLGAYEEIFKNELLVGSFRNTFLILFIGVALSMIVTTMAAYFFSRKDIMLQKPLFLLVLLTMFVSGGLVPLYLTVCDLGIDDTLWAVILPTAVSTYNLIVLRTGFMSVPESLIESAKLDGASDFTVFSKIVLPLSKAPLAVILLYYLVENWNSWFNASIFLRDKSLYPLQLVLRQILLSNNTDSMMGGADVGDYESFSETLKYAIICISTVPMLLIYPFLQKHFAKGVMIGAVKG